MLLKKKVRENFLNLKNVCTKNKIQSWKFGLTFFFLVILFVFVRVREELRTFFYVSVLDQI